MSQRSLDSWGFCRATAAGEGSSWQLWSEKIYLGHDRSVRKVAHHTLACESPDLQLLEVTVSHNPVKWTEFHFKRWAVESHDSNWKKPQTRRVMLSDKNLSQVLYSMIMFQLAVNIYIPVLWSCGCWCLIPDGLGIIIFFASLLHSEGMQYTSRAFSIIIIIICFSFLD